MLRNLFVAFALIVSVSLTSFAQAPPSADAYVTSAQPAANFGISALLPVQAGTTSYVRLNLGALPANSTIAKATLRLYVNAVAAPGSFDVYQVESGWSEKGLSFNSAPTLGGSATGGKPVAVTAASQNQFILVDITPLAQGWLDGSIPNHGVALALTSPGGSFSFDSKESVGTGHQPELEVVLGGAVGALGASAGTSTSSVSSTSTVAGALASPQFTGTYNNSVTLSNTSNSFTGTFTGNGSALTGVTSGLSWPIVTKNANYTLQTSDFSTPTQHGNYIILTGPVSHTFTLPNPPPPNGSCVAIGNVADAGINSGTNVFLSVSPNGLPMDATVPTFTPAQARRVAYLYCSDGAGYHRLGYSQNGVSEIGPWLKTVDTGAVDALTTTFRNGIDLGLIPGTMFYLLPVHHNTVSNPTLNVNGLGAKPIVKFGNQALAPNDLTTTAYAHLFYDGANWQLLNPQTNQGTVTAVTATAPLASSGGPAPVISCPGCVTTPTLNGTTASIGGRALTAGTCTTGTATVTGATVGHPAYVSAGDGSLPDGLIILSAAVTSPGTVTVQLCATGSVTPAAKTYNVATQ